MDILTILSRNDEEKKCGTDRHTQRELSTSCVGEFERVWEGKRQKDRETEICSSDPEMETEIDSAATLYSHSLSLSLFLFRPASSSAHPNVKTSVAGSSLVYTFKTHKFCVYALITVKTI